MHTRSEIPSLWAGLLNLLKDVGFEKTFRMKRFRGLNWR
jgi:hypothetical protein